MLRSAFGAGHFAKSLAWSFTDLLLAYYANIRLGLTAQETGLLLLVSMAQGAALDIGVAFLLRRAEGNRRRILTIQFLAGLATAAALLFVFNPVHGAVTPFLYLIASLAVLRIAYAFYDVAQNALVSLLPEDEDDARRYIVWRQILGALARIGVAMLAFLLVGLADTGRERLAAAGIALLIVLSAGWIFTWAAASRPPRAIPPGPWLATPAGLPRLLLAGAAQAGPLSLAARMLTFVGGSVPYDRVGATLLFGFVLGTLVGPLLLPRSGARGDGRGGYGGRTALAYTTLTVVAAALFLANPHSGAVALAACFAHGVGLGAIMASFWAEMSAAIREHARRTGIRTDMTAFALLTATIKVSGAIFGFWLGLLLDGFKAGNPLTMATLVAITAGGGIVFLLASAPPRRNGARA